MGPELYHRYRFRPVIADLAIQIVQMKDSEKPPGTDEYVERLKKELKNLDNDTMFDWKIKISEEMLSMEEYMLPYTLRRIIDIVVYDKGNLRNLFRIGHCIGLSIAEKFDMTIYENKKWNKISTYIKDEDYKRIYYDIACKSDKENLEIKKSEWLVYYFDRLIRNPTSQKPTSI